LFIAPGAEVVEPCYWCGRVRGDEIPVLVEQRHVRAWIGDEGVEVGGENGVPEGAVAGVVVYWEGGDSADVDSGYGEVGVRADCAVGDGAGAVFGDCGEEEGLACLLIYQYAILSRRNDIALTSC
jgi:hypothetical protein